MSEHSRDPDAHPADRLRGMYRINEPSDEPRGGGLEQPASGRPLLQYEGRIYIRPLGRGVVLEDDVNQMYLEDLPDGYYRAEIRIWREAPA